MWKEVGRPKSGGIYLAKTKAKFDYKSYIANKTKMERSQISNSLHDALLNKDNNNFWNIWNSNFGTANSRSTFINGTLLFSSMFTMIMMAVLLILIQFLKKGFQIMLAIN